jgi:hypothetical protein
MSAEQLIQYLKQHKRFTWFMKFSLIITELARTLLWLYNLVSTIFNNVDSIMLSSAMTPAVSNLHQKPKCGVLFPRGKRVVRGKKAGDWRQVFLWITEHIITLTVNPSPLLSS